MPGVEMLKLLADLGGLGVLALFIIVGGMIARAGIGLFRAQVLPMVQNHFSHLEEGYQRLAAAIERMSQVQGAQARALDVHNELTRDLIKRLPKNDVKKLIE